MLLMLSVVSAGGQSSVWVAMSSAERVCGPVPAVPISVWPENTQRHDYLCTQVGHIQENTPAD